MTKPLLVGYGFEWMCPILPLEASVLEAYLSGSFLSSWRPWLTGAGVVVILDLNFAGQWPSRSKFGHLCFDRLTHEWRQCYPLCKSTRNNLLKLSASLHFSFLFPFIVWSNCLRPLTIKATYPSFHFQTSARFRQLIWLMSLLLWYCCLEMCR